MFTNQFWVLAVFVASLLTPAFGWADEAKEPAKPELSDDEKPFLELANQARAKAKLPALALNKQLLKVARDHAANMANKSEMNHVLDGKDPAQRVKATSYEFERVAESIASCEKSTADVVFKNWMETLHNKENILNEDFKELGIGVAKNDRGETYYTIVFAAARARK
jgi:uncharacterized protein YkwD